MTLSRSFSTFRPLTNDRVTTTDNASPNITHNEFSYYRGPAPQYAQRWTTSTRSRPSFNNRWRRNNHPISWRWCHHHGTIFNTSNTFQPFQPQHKWYDGRRPLCTIIGRVHQSIYKGPSIESSWRPSSTQPPSQSPKPKFWYSTHPPKGIYRSPRSYRSLRGRIDSRFYHYPRCTN